MSYKFKSYLTVGLYTNKLKSPNNSIDESFFSYSVGLGFNLWQFASTQEMAVRLHHRFMLIPFIKLNYISSFNEFQIGDDDSWKEGRIEFQIGIKLGNIGR